jgi:uncharacterized protein DUF4928
MTLFNEPEHEITTTGQNSPDLPAPGTNVLETWLQSCTRGKKVSRNTVAVGIVILDHLRRRFPPVRAEIVSGGGEIRGSRGTKLRGIFQKYGLPASYLKEVTTRQGHQDGQRLLTMCENDTVLATVSFPERDHILELLITRLASVANEWLSRPSLEMDLERRETPSSWVQQILIRVKGKSGGIVEQHLVGAKLERRYASENITIPNHPAHAGDLQTERQGDFVIGNTVYHITSTPGEQVIQKCSASIQRGEHPILLVPRDKQAAAVGLAEIQGIENQLSIVALEDFIALNIIELATVRKITLFDVFNEVISTYNRRLEEVETDMSLKINVR